MFKSKWKMAGAGLLLVVLGTAGWQVTHQRAPAQADSKENVPAVQHISGDTLKYAADAPQLLFLQIQPVQAYPEPLVEALNARITYDDNRTARVYSTLAGRVVRIPAEVGRQVKAGDPLVVLDSPDFAVVEADRAKAEADEARKKIAWERAKQLYEIKGLARKDVEAAEADWHQAQAEAERTRARMKNLSAGSGESSGQFVLRAPVSGYITERQVSAGSEVRPDAANPLFVISDPRHLWVLVDLPERQLAKVQIGHPVTLEVDAYPGVAFPGRITVIGGALDPVTRRVQVRCEADNPELKLKPEMFARVTPVANKQSSMPRVPNTALVTQGLYSFVFVEVAPGELQRRKVMLDMQGSQYTYIREGLKAGERVVSTGALLLNAELAGAE